MRIRILITIFIMGLGNSALAEQFLFGKETQLSVNSNAWISAQSRQFFKAGLTILENKKHPELRAFLGSQPTSATPQKAEQHQSLQAMCNNLKSAYQKLDQLQATVSQTTFEKQKYCKVSFENAGSVTEQYLFVSKALANSITLVYPKKIQSEAAVEIATLFKGFKVQR